MKSYTRTWCRFHMSHRSNHARYKLKIYRKLVRFGVAACNTLSQVIWSRRIDLCSMREMTFTFSGFLCRQGLAPRLCLHKLSSKQSRGWTKSLGRVFLAILRHSGLLMLGRLDIFSSTRMLIRTNFWTRCTRSGTVRAFTASRSRRLRKTCTSRCWRV